MRLEDNTPTRLAGMLGRAAIAVLALGAWLAFSPAALAHGRDAVPSEPEALAQYKAGLEAYYSEDYGAALKAWSPLAEGDSGSAAAQIFLGFMYANGLGVEKDPKAAITWYGRAARHDHALAQIRLALLYGAGADLEKDPIKAHAWAALAAREAGHLHGPASALRETLERRMTPEQVAEAEALAADWAAAHRSGE